MNFFATVSESFSIDPALSTAANFSEFHGLGLLIAFLVIWSLIWKGIALWKSARRKQKGWFIALLILNTAGLLPILYIVFFSKKKKEE